MFYLTIYFFTALAVFGLKGKAGANRWAYLVVLTLFFLLTAFRFEVGCDWTGYFFQFNYDKLTIEIDARSWLQDPLWWELIRTIRGSGLDYPWLNVASALIFFLGVHLVARRQPDPLAFLVLIWPILIVNIGMSGIRQATALGILCIAYNAFVDRRVVLFTLLVLLASTIHSSALVFLLLVPMVGGAFSRLRILLSALLMIPGLSLMASSAAGDVAISRYIVNDVDAAGAAFRVGLLALTGIAFFTFLRKPWLRSNAADYTLANIGSLGMIALMALLPLSTVIADRMGYYLIPIQAMILARIRFLEVGRSRTLLVFAAYALLGLTLLVWVWLSSHYDRCYVPYQTWLIGTPTSRFGF